MMQLFLLASWFSVTVLIVAQHKTAGPYGAAQILSDNNHKLDTLPIAVTDLGGVVLSLPVALIARSYGWRYTLAIAGLTGTVASALAAIGLKYENLEVYLAGSFLLAGLNVAGYLVRFAAAESIKTQNKDKIISIVLVGSAVTGSFGPQLVTLGKSLAPHYAGVYFVTAGLSVVVILIALSLKAPSEKKKTTTIAVPSPTKNNEDEDYDDLDNNFVSDGDDDDDIEDKQSKMSLVRALFTPHVFCGVICSASAMYSMLLIMSATPGAMNGETSRYGFGLSSTETTIQLHIVSMFVPGLVSGDLLSYVGHCRFILLGLLFNYGAILIGMFSTELKSFIVCLILVGLGWNLTYIGGTKLLMEGYRRTHSSSSQIKKLQGLNESIAQGAATVGALLAGIVLDIGNGRWSLVMWYALPSIAIANVAVVLLMLYERCMMHDGSGETSSYHSLDDKGGDGEKGDPHVA